jgi:hypothetical protein
MATLAGGVAAPFAFQIALASLARRLAGGLFCRRHPPASRSSVLAPVTPCALL